jgi:DNA repair protein RecN (Recombination protein N)
MIQNLFIQNIVLVERLALSFNEGFIVFTGETGAGKSILLDALGLALGSRADTQLIRTGEKTASVAVTFHLPNTHPTFLLLQEKGLPMEEGLTLRRVLYDDGRSRSFINDHPVSVSFLKEIGQSLVEIHGQFDHLLEVKTHRKALDTYGNYGDPLQKVSQNYQSWKSLEAAYTRQKETETQRIHHQEYLHHTLKELEAFKPLLGEEDSLHQRKQTLLSQERFLKNIQNASSFLKEKIPLLAGTLKELARLPHLSMPTLLSALTHLGTSLQEMEEGATDLDKLLWEIHQEENNLEDIDERLHQLRSLARKHRCVPDELPVLLQRLEGDAAQWEESTALLKKLKVEKKAAQEAYEEEAKKLSAARGKAALDLDQAMTQELPFLKLASVQFKTILIPLPQANWGPQGVETVEFHVSTNPGSPLSLLSQVASGGELSRIMLALKVVLADSMGVPTLLFDEIDSGTGGAVAAALGDRLAKLSRSLQVLAITHSPQVASRGEAHFQVIKTSSEGRVGTQVTLLSPQERQEEIARMLSGSQITEEARSAAGRLMT